MADFKLKPGAGTGNKLILESQDGTDVLTTSDSGVAITAPTIADLSNVTGTLPVGVTGGSGLTALASNPTITLGSNTTFPSGMITNVFKFKVTDGGLPTSTGTKSVAFDAISWTTVSGKIYIIHTKISCRPTKHSTGAASGLTQSIWTYYGTTDRSAGDTSFDTELDEGYIGRNLVTSATATGIHGYHYWSPVSYFTAGSSATHYFYPALNGNSSVTARMYSHTDEPWDTIIYEVSP
jgi:hypothetical protein